MRLTPRLIGHGFGLPHTDENFLNKDLGNCMDYTNNPAANRSPDSSNYEFLAELYGIIPGSDAVSSQETVPGNRHLSLDTPDESLPDWVQFAYEDAVVEIEKETDPGENWRLLHESTHGRAHEVDLGNGFTLEVHKLLVPDL